MDASIDGRPAQDSDLPDPAFGSLMVAMLYDADMFRAFAEFLSMLALPEEILARPGLADRVIAMAAEREALAPPGPSRNDVLRLLA
jgi:hypothetical protein